MKKTIIAVLLFLIGSIIFAQQNVSNPQKFALIIGNSNYAGISRLNNPVNDANDMYDVLRGLGFTVEKVLNGNRVTMENEIMKLKDKLKRSRNAYGFFYYAGHGVQFNGDNYLIPVDAEIPSENLLRDRAVSLQFIQDELSDANNEFNFIVLDSCRDNPFEWSRNRSASVNRGLAVVTRAPQGSVVFYAAAAGQAAADGTERNGLFTSKFINYLKDPELEVRELIRLTGNAVEQASGGRQNPASYFQFNGKAYLGTRPISSQGRSYKIGDRGPAGGIVFYDKEYSSDGWRYLEAAPVDTEAKNLQWGAYGYNVVDTQVRTGSGKENTRLIIRVLRDGNESGRAAQFCVDLDFGGMTDWFLPSRDELLLMYKNLHSIGLGEFQNARYWSSSQASIRDAWYLHFGEDGRASSNYAKDRTSFFLFSNDIYTRAIRSFQ